MNTNKFARTRLPTAKNAPDRVSTNSTVTGMNLSRREEKNRPENEAYLRGIKKVVVSDLQRDLGIPSDAIIRGMDEEFPEFRGIEI